MRLTDRQRLHIFPDSDALSRAAAHAWERCALESIEVRGIFHVALSGGSTPRRVFEYLRDTALPWDKMHFYWGDERDVPLDHPDSNFRMAREALLDHVPVVPEQLHPIHPQADIEQAVAAYSAELAKHLRLAVNGWPCFDLIMLGMGADGHTASLFPGTRALNVTDRVVCSVYIDKLQSWRMTLTYPVLNQARQLMFLVSGSEKAAVLGQVFNQAEQIDYPIQAIQPQGEVDWYVDTAAASDILRA